MTSRVTHGLHGAPLAASRVPTSCAPLSSASGTSRRARLPDLDDLCGGPGAAAQPRPRGDLRTAAELSRYDPTLSDPSGKARADRRTSMTEKQGGLDVRANQTAGPSADADGSYTLTGHKWFTSAPMSRVCSSSWHRLGGLSCFFLPRVLPDGSRNRCVCSASRASSATMPTRRRKSNTTVRLPVGRRRGARGAPMHRDGQLHPARLRAGQCRQHASRSDQAIHHAQYRKVFGEYLIGQPLMRNVLADLAIESEAATMVSMRMAGATDAAERGDDTEAPPRRISRPPPSIGSANGQPRMSRSLHGMPRRQLRRRRRFS